jgi:hypothetical protein
MSPILAVLKTGDDLVNSLWNAVGVVIIFGAVIMIIFKFFIGAQKNVGGGVAALAATPSVVLALGNTLKALIGL